MLFARSAALTLMAAQAAVSKRASSVASGTAWWAVNAFLDARAGGWVRSEAE